MEVEDCLVIYDPYENEDSSALVLSSGLSGINTRTLPDNKRISMITWHSGQCDSDLPTRLHSFLTTTSTNLYISQPLSSHHAVCLVRVQGMVCTSCVKLIETTLSKEDGVHGVKVSLSGSEAMVEFNPAQLDGQNITSAIDDMGFEAELITTYTAQVITAPPSSGVHIEPHVESVVISVEGMVCQSCVSNIQTNIAKLNGVESLLVSLANKNATVSYDKMVITVEELCTAIEDLGFEASCEGMTAEVQGAENKGEDLDDNRNAITVIPSSDSDGAESDNPLLSPNEKGLTQSHNPRKKKVRLSII